MGENRTNGRRQPERGESGDGYLEGRGGQMGVVEC